MIDSFKKDKNYKDTINKLNEIYRNLYWIFNYEAQNIPGLIDKKLWEKVEYNPVLFFKEVEDKILLERLQDKSFCELISNVYQKYKEYLNSQSTWMDLKYKKEKKKCIAYFSAEYGFHESLPVYSGGLGILAGDHCSSASDLGLNFIGIGLLYKNGYFQQKIDQNGYQKSFYPKYDFGNLPVQLVKKNDKPLIITVQINGRNVNVQIWELSLGRIKLYFLDTDRNDNNENDRNITAQLYCSDRHMRISQEIILGIGGVRAIRKLNLNPAVWHLNEGHSAFIIMELASEIMNEKKVSFKGALEYVKKKIVFTTHTPVKEGNEAFSFLLIKKYFKDYTGQFNININDILEQGVSGKLEDTDEFSMTIFSLKNAVFKNGVSQLHGRVSQKMWHNVWPEMNLDEVPIDYVTNGINLFSWLSYDLCVLFSKYIDNDWKNKIDCPDIWKKVFNIPAQELWDVHLKLKKDLIDFTCKEIYNFYKGNHVDIKIINRIIDSLDHNHLIIGFARRFASYKRAALLFNDMERINRIFNDKNKPVHIIFSGKAHPSDNSGCDLIKQIYDYSLKEEFLGKIIFLPNYNIHIARYMVRGTDVWLNNPRRPYEASGTSGQKAAVNGVINLSVLDGWWVEAYNKKNGWVIGSEKDYDDMTLQDKEDSHSLYDILEKDVIPYYYKHSNGYSEKWVKMMKESIASNLPVFNTIRMVKEYCRKFYFPIMNRNK